MQATSEKFEKYSVLMSVYSKDNPAYLKQSIDSMLCQTIRPDQIVLVKDGSVSPSMDVLIERYQKRNPGLFDVVHLLKNEGLGVALDEGLKHCRNELVARMDADDISVPDRCEKQLEIFRRHPELSVVSGNIGEFVKDPKHLVAVRTVPEHNEAIKKRMRIRSAFNHPAVMYRKSDVLRCGGYGSFRRKQDHVLFSHMLNSGCKGYNIQDTILLFRADRNSIKRKKSWENCRGYIEAQYYNFKRRECSFPDLLFVVVTQLAVYALPVRFVDVMTKLFIRNRA